MISSMDSRNAGTVQNMVAGAALLFLYGWTFWRVWKRNRGNKLMECAGISGSLFLVMFAVMKIPGCPDWVVPSLGLLGLLVGFAMIFFIFKGAFLAVRAKFRSKNRVTSNST